MFLLIRISDACKSDIRCNLHSTMFLLIRVANLATALIATFTFHYVSTYTGATPKQASDIDIFTFHYVSTYTVCRSCSPSPDSHLHSTMFLLIHGRPRSHQMYTIIYIPLCFYLYYEGRKRPTINSNLHSTMFLLILYVTNQEIRIYVSFTFHYVSTYTRQG